MKSEVGSSFLPNSEKHNKRETRHVSIRSYQPLLARLRGQGTGGSGLFTAPPPSGAHLHKEAAVLSDDLKGKKWAVKTEGKGR